jgi:hypothetical protein
LRFSQRPVAIVFGPENGAVSEKLVFEAAREAHAKNFTHLSGIPRMNAEPAGIFALFPHSGKIGWWHG